MTYNSRYLSALDITLVLDLLIADKTYPRSLHFQLLRLKEHFDDLPGNRQCPRNSEQIIVSRLLTPFEQVNFDALLEVAHDGTRPQLSRFTDELIEQLHQLSDSINRTYLSHITEQVHLTYSET